MHRRVRVAERRRRLARRGHQRGVVRHLGIHLEPDRLGQRPRPEEAARDLEQARRVGRLLAHPCIAAPARHPPLTVRLPLAVDDLRAQAGGLERRREQRVDAAVLVLADDAHAEARERAQVDEARDAHARVAAPARPRKRRHDERAVEQPRHVHRHEQVEDLIVPAVVGVIGEELLASRVDDAQRAVRHHDCRHAGRRAELPGAPGGRLLDEFHVRVVRKRGEQCGGRGVARRVGRVSSERRGKEPGGKEHSGEGCGDCRAVSRAVLAYIVGSRAWQCVHPCGRNSLQRPLKGTAAIHPNADMQ